MTLTEHTLTVTAPKNQHFGRTANEVVNKP